MADRYRDDARGNPVTNATPAIIDQLDRLADILLRRGAGAEPLGEALAQSQDCPMALASAAALHLLSDTRPGMVTACGLLARAAAAARHATEREQLFIEALDAIADDRPLRAADRFRHLAEVAPRDLLTAYLAQLHLLNHGMMAPMLDQARHITAADPDNGAALGMLAFALDQNGAPEAAEATGLAACAADDQLPWAHHALAHAYSSLGRIEEGLSFLDAQSARWDECGSSMYTHNWWHAMLLRLRLGERHTVLAVYDQRFASELGQSTSSFVNAVSLLARLELEGLDVGDRWEPLAAFAAAHSGEHVLPFLDIHYALALARAGWHGPARELVESTRRRADGAPPEMCLVWRRAGLPLVEAAAAYGMGDGAGAAELFERAACHAHLVGGSNVQRALFAQLARAAQGTLRSAA